jgi:hypothetical protein
MMMVKGTNVQNIFTILINGTNVRMSLAQWERA